MYSILEHKQYVNYMDQIVCKVYEILNVDVTYIVCGCYSMVLDRYGLCDIKK